MPTWLRENARMVAATAAIVLALLLGFFVGRSSVDDNSKNLSIQGDFSGTVVRVSADGDAAVLRSDDGDQVDAALLTLRPDLKAGTHIVGTFVDATISGDTGPYLLVLEPKMATS